MRDLRLPRARGRPDLHLPLAAAVWVAEASSARGRGGPRLNGPTTFSAAAEARRGVLTEAKTRGDETIAAVGVGVNALGSAERFDGRATTLEAEGQLLVSAAGFFRELWPRLRPVSPRAPERPGSSKHGSERSRHAPGDEIRVIVENGTGTGARGAHSAGPRRTGSARPQSPGAEVVVASGEVQTW